MKNYSWQYLFMICFFFFFSCVQEDFSFKEWEKTFLEKIQQKSSFSAVDKKIIKKIVEHLEKQRPSLKMSEIQFFMNAIAQEKKKNVYKIKIGYKSKKKSKEGISFQSGLFPFEIRLKLECQSKKCRIEILEILESLEKEENKGQRLSRYGLFLPQLYRW